MELGSLLRVVFSCSFKKLIIIKIIETVVFPWYLARPGLRKYPIDIMERPKTMILLESYD